MSLAAAIQMTSTDNKTRNLDVAIEKIRWAADHGANYVALPETFFWMGPATEFAEAAEPLDGPTLSALAAVARENHLTLLGGSILESGAPEGRVYNTSVLFGPDGAALAVYRKMHLFDVDLDVKAVYRESSKVAPGTEIVTAETPIGTVGLSICYDLRFPELYREQVERGATVLNVPAAFTLMTGKDHWEPLLRARAIENQCWVIAPAQWGQHSENRSTFGHAMIVDPWGLVVAQASDGEGVAMAHVDDAVTTRVRQAIPALRHRRVKS